MSSWQQLQTLLTHSPRHAQSILRQPCRFPLPDRGTSNNLMSKATSLGMANQLSRYLLSSLAHQTANDPREAEYLELLSTVAPEVSLATLEGTSWLMVPLLTTQGVNGGRLVHVLAGLVPGQQPLLAAVGFSAGSRDALQIAYSACSRLHHVLGKSLVVIALTSQQTPPICGCSLALSFSFATYLLDRQRPWPEGIYATGCLDSRGSVIAVDGIEEKCRVARVHSGKAIFVAAGNREDVPYPLVAVPCTTLAQALNDLEYVLLANEPDELVKFRPFLLNEKLLLTHFYELPSSLLQHPECKQALQSIAEHPDDYLYHAVRALHNCAFDVVRAIRLTSLFPIETLQELIDRGDDQTAQNIYEWCINLIACANHCGNTHSIQPWRNFQHSLENTVAADQHLVAWNHLFVADRFNRYHFDPEIPEDIKRLIAEEEARNIIAPRPNKNLGAMYGTLSQNCGFCGPNLFAGLVAYAEKAEASFDKRFAMEKSRLHNYRIYGYLDRLEFQDAGAWLSRYLGLAQNSSPESWLDQISNLLTGNREGRLFALALVLRTLADMGFRPRKMRLHTMTTEVVRKIPRHAQHPWQLILMNLARLVGDSGSAAECRVLLQRAATVCEAGGETMQAMVLLVYAEMQFQGVIDRAEVAAAETARQLVLASRYLYQPHFQSLRNEPDTEAMLASVHRDRSTLFPFSYR